MDADDTRAEAERDESWANLWALRQEIQRVAQGDLADPDRERQLLRVPARVVATELDYRAKATG